MGMEKCSFQMDLNKVGMFDHNTFVSPVKNKDPIPPEYHRGSKSLEKYSK